MIRLIQRRLIIPRGDTGEFEVPVLKFAEGQNVAVFSIIDLRTRSIIYRKEIQVEGNSFKIEFTHNDTVNLPVGKYVWDIKFYKNPVYADEELINGEEIDSYYSGFSLPDCEIRPTGDKLAMSDAAPAATLAPDQLDIITAAINEIHSSLSSAEDYAEAAEAAWHLLESCSAEAVSVEPDEPASARYEDGTFYFEIPKGEVPDISGKADKTDTLLYTTLSRGRADNSTVGIGSFAFGDNVIASTDYAHAEGASTSALGPYSHAENVGTQARGLGSHAEGNTTLASRMAAHAEGYGTVASGDYSHAEGEETNALGEAAHAEGFRTSAGAFTHAEGYRTQATGTGSHSEGSYTVANHKSQHVFGEYNVADPALTSATNRGNFVEIVGNGTSSTNSNARALDWSGNEYLNGTLYINCGNESENGEEVATVSAIPTNISELVNDENYITSADIPADVSAFNNDVGYLTEHIFATDEEIQAIIDEYGQEEEGMVVEAKWIVPEQGNPYYLTETSAEDILTAFRSGKNVVVHFEWFDNFDTDNNGPATYSINNNIYGQLVLYQDDYITSINETVPQFVVGPGEMIGSYVHNHGTIENGYVKFEIYID